MQYGPSLGFSPLREWLANKHDVPTDHVMLANGSLQFLDFIGLGVLQRGDRVLVESPTYDRTLTLLRRHGLQIGGIPLQDDGPDLAALEAVLGQEVPKLMYVIPDFQNPSGATMSLAKRERLVALARRYDVRLLEDAPYRPLRYRGTQLPALFDLAPERTLYMSSFTKQISPGVRVGYLLGEPAMLKKLAKVAEDTYITPNLVGAAAVYEFCQRGYLDNQLKSLRTLYSERMDVLCTTLRELLPSAKWIEPDGGFFLSITLAEGTTNEALRKNAAALQLNLSDGRGFFPVPSDGERFLRLPFCALTPDEIREGVRRLAQAVQQTSNQPVGAV